MHNVCFTAQKCSDPFFTDCLQRFVQCCLISRKEIIPHCGRTRFIDHFKRPVGRLKPIDIDVYFSAIPSNSTRQRRMNEFRIDHAFLPHQRIPVTISASAHDLLKIDGMDGAISKEKYPEIVAEMDRLKALHDAAKKQQPLV